MRTLAIAFSIAFGIALAMSATVALADSPAGDFAGNINPKIAAPASAEWIR